MVKESELKYNVSVSNLTVLLSYQKLKNDKRREILDWLIRETRWEEKHGSYSNRRVPNTGTWFLESKEFQAWFKGSSQVLLCDGAGMELVFQRDLMKF